MNKDSDLLLPGEDLIRQGLLDLRQNNLTEFALLVLIAAPRLRRLGMRVPERTFPQPCEHELYERLEKRLGPAAHSYFNSLLRRVASYAHALEREQQKSGGDCSSPSPAVECSDEL